MTRFPQATSFVPSRLRFDAAGAAAAPAAGVAVAAPEKADAAAAPATGGAAAGVTAAVAEVCFSLTALRGAGSMSTVREPGSFVLARYVSHVTHGHLFFPAKKVDLPGPNRFNMTFFTHGGRSTRTP
jgi:hypothetical protein